MGELKLISDFSPDTILLSNIYIDEYMPANNESQVKIYLYLLRNLSAGLPVSVSSIADAFNYSMSDVERALVFMQKQGLMSLEERDGSIEGLRLLPLRKNNADSDIIPISSVKQGDKLMDFTSKPEIQQLLFAAEQYLGKTLNPSDINSILYVYETLNFSDEMIDYLIEYCASHKKTAFTQIEKTALEWSKQGVSTLDDIKAMLSKCPKEVYEVFNFFGIKGGRRKPTPQEVSYVDKWRNEFLFSPEIIKKACELTLDKIHSVSFEYADAILCDWNRRGVKTLSDIDGIKNNKKPAQQKDFKSKTVRLSNKREYDYDELERKLLSN